MYRWAGSCWLNSAYWWTAVFYIHVWFHPGHAARLFTLKLAEHSHYVLMPAPVICWVINKALINIVSLKIVILGYRIRHSGWRSGVQRTYKGSTPYSDCALFYVVCMSMVQCLLNPFISVWLFRCLHELYHQLNCFLVLLCFVDAGSVYDVYCIFWEI